MKLKKEFASFYQEIRIDSESHVLKDKREVLEDDIKSNLPGILSEHGISVSKSNIHMALISFNLGIKFSNSEPNIDQYWIGFDPSMGKL